MDERTVKWLWDAADYLDQTSSSAKLISRHLREVSTSGLDKQGHWMRTVKDENGMPKLCPQCLIPWSTGNYSIKLVPLKNSKKKKRSLQRLLGKKPSTLNSFQIGLLSRINLKPATLMRIACHICKKITKIYLTKPNYSCTVKTQKETNLDVFEDDSALASEKLLPKKKKKKRKKDRLCGLKFNAVSQVKKAKAQSQPLSLPNFTGKSPTNYNPLNETSASATCLTSSSCVFTAQEYPNTNKSDLPLVNPKKLIESHDKIHKSLEQIFYNLEKDSAFDTINREKLFETYENALPKTINDVSSESTTLNISNSSHKHKNVENLEVNSDSFCRLQNNLNETSVNISGCKNSLVNKNKRLNNNSLDFCNKRSKSIDFSVEKNHIISEANLPRTLPSIRNSNESDSSFPMKLSSSKKVNVFSQSSSSNTIQKKFCSVSNSKPQNNKSKQYDDRANQKTCNYNFGNTSKAAVNCKANFPTAAANKKSLKNEKKKLKSNKRKKNSKMKKSNHYRVFEKSNSGESVSINDLLSLT